MNEVEARKILRIGNGETLSTGLIEERARRSAVFHSEQVIEEAGGHLLAICRVKQLPMDQLLARVQAPAAGQSNQPAQRVWPPPPPQTLRPQDVTYVTVRRGGKTFTSVMVHGIVKLSFQTVYTRLKFIIKMTNHY